MATHNKPAVLCISGLDATGGAGIQADIEALAANGAHCLPVISSLTVQDTKNVLQTRPVDASLMEQQIHTVLADITPSAIKLGLIDSIAAMQVIERVLHSCRNIPVIVDPILRAGGGYEFSGESLLDYYRDRLLPYTTVLTPNLPELLTLAGTDDMNTGVSQLTGTSKAAILLTGTHDTSDQVTNRLFDSNGNLLQQWHWPRLPDTYHGSGCTLASALAAHLAHGLNLSEAAASAQDYTWHALKAGWRAGAGQLIPGRNDVPKPTRL